MRYVSNVYFLFCTFFSLLLSSPLYLVLDFCFWISLEQKHKHNHAQKTDFSVLGDWKSSENVWLICSKDRKRNILENDDETKKNNKFTDDWMQEKQKKNWLNGTKIRS